MKKIAGAYKFWLIWVIFISLASSLNAQIRYKHIPRVKVKQSKPTNPVIANEAKFDQVPLPAITVQVKTPDMDKTMIELAENTNDQSITASRKNGSIWKEERPVSIIHPTIAKHPIMVSLTIKKSKHGLKKISVVQKNQMDKWMLVMIILYIIGVVLLVASLIFLHILQSAAIYYVLLILSLLCLLAASIILPLGLAGVI